MIVRRMARINSSGAVDFSDPGPGTFTCSYAANVYTIGFPETFVDANSVCVNITPWVSSLTPSNIARTARVYSITATGCLVVMSLAAVNNSPSPIEFTIEVAGETA